ncbi:2-epi-5-epi-valiolone synthase-like isoform X1 [Mastacembelus armatus]|uniref:2-epi-5-epi-valiolone synthase-like isoform X1 n=1 Tax=Mastacembelus armatus TaxID=205130 RepID=UPI000E455C39|nr:2-epi-5-epi-valiolone synthase-like isoform X1 [Mastacembelus armatus]XP_026187541.1 2-epi-5-epi-valiolone synthase-like isoform X1 [Mastacembelus armatus]
MLSNNSKFNLVQVKGTWVRQTERCQSAQGKLSDAKIYENKSDHGVCWTVVSPIVFTYRVIQSKNILDPKNDTLLWGHVGEEEEELKGTINNSKPVKRFVVIDETVNQLYGSQLIQYFESREVVYRMLPLPTTEENKCLELVTKILEEIHQFGIDRRSEPIIAIGGGVCLDVVGLAASLYRRRTPYIKVPTTLLSYVDASVGAKTGVNFAGGKNKLGSYVPPVATFLDRSFFQTLPPRQISNGMAEMLKMALMKHHGLFELLEAEGRKLLLSKLQSCESDSGVELEDSATASTRIAIETMLEELAPNLWEDDLDRLVDFGHLISPELEMTVLPTLLHGEAVNIDMSFMVYVAHQRGLLTADEKYRIIQCMLGLELPVWHQECTLPLVQKSLNERLKHSAGSLRMPLPTGLGRAEIFHDMIGDNVLCQAYQKWTAELASSGNK